MWRSSSVPMRVAVGSAVQPGIAANKLNATIVNPVPLRSA